MITSKNFNKGDQVLLYDSKLHLFPSKLKSQWTSPFIIHQAYLNGSIDLLNPKDKKIFKVNGNESSLMLFAILQKRRIFPSLILHDRHSCYWAGLVFIETKLQLKNFGFLFGQILVILFLVFFTYFSFFIKTFF